MMGKNFEDYDMSTRLHNGLKSLDWETPSQVKEAFERDFDHAVETFLRMPNCGRNTLNELLEVFEISRPVKTKARLVKFENADELLQFINAEGGIDSQKQDAYTLRLLLQLVSMDLVLPAPSSSHHYYLTSAGTETLGRWNMIKEIELTIKAPRTIILDLIRSLPDSYPYLEKLEDAMHHITHNEKTEIVLGS